MVRDISKARQSVRRTMLLWPETPRAETFQIFLYIHGRWCTLPASAHATRRVSAVVSVWAGSLS